MTARVVNGTPGGVGTEVRITIGLLPAGRIVLIEQAPDLHAAIDCGVDRLARTVARRMERGRRCDSNTSYRGEGDPMKAMKILVPLDGSPWAEAALPKAVELVQQNNGAKLVLVRAVDPASLPGVGFTTAQVAAINEAAEYLRSVAAQLQNEGVDLVVRSVWYAAAGPAIVEAARTVKPDFIVMVSSGADRLIPGRVAEFVLHRMRMPIVLVAAGKAPAETPAGRTSARGTEMIHA